jgi:hypothetical protein
VNKFEVDISNPDAIRDALDEITEQVQSARSELAQLEQIRSRLAVLASGLKERHGADTIQQAVVAIVNERGGPTRAADVMGALPQPSERKTVNWALWKSDQEGLLRKIDTGVYAPLDYASDQDELPVESNGAGVTELRGAPH